ncbi:F-box protein [Legionella saoudiensis]|uniref:F-box protein n=1 Tax=Legionella saoudiensis TaxID=1750561 RepID=UPI00073011B3|nr:F-box protein [Legionella saoudiensis]
MTNNQKAQMATKNITDLPMPMLFDVLSFLKMEDILALSVVDRRFHNILKNENFWENKLHQHFPFHPRQENQNSYEAFLQSYRENYAHLSTEHRILFSRIKARDPSFVDELTAADLRLTDARGRSSLSWLVEGDLDDNLRHKLFEKKELYRALGYSEEQWLIICSPLSLIKDHLDKSQSFNYKKALEVAATFKRWDVCQELLARTNGEVEASVFNRLFKRLQHFPLESAPLPALITAVLKRNIHEIQKICGQREHLKAAAEDMDIALLEAIARGEIEIVAYFCDMLSKTSEIMNPGLKQAGRYGHLNVVQFLMDKFQFSSEIIDELYVDAAFYGHVHIMCFLEKRKELTQKTAQRALMRAVESERLHVLRYMKEKHIDFDADPHLLPTAAQTGNLSIIQFIIENIEVTPEILGEALEEAACYAGLPVVEFFCKMNVAEKYIDRALKNTCESYQNPEEAQSILEFFCKMSTANRPTKMAFEELLSNLLRKGDYNLPWLKIKTICEISHQNQPSSELLIEVLEKAITPRNQNLEILHILCNSNYNNRIPTEKIKLMRQNGLVNRDADALLRYEKLSNLHDKIRSFLDYGNELVKAGAPEGAYVLQQAEKLKALTTSFSEYYFKHEGISSLSAIKADFKATLKESYENMGNHRAQWKPILANIVMAATGLGLLVILTNLLETGSLLFMETSRQRKLQAIDAALESPFCGFPVIGDSMSFY